MAPVACWQPQDLYAAIDRARWAWEATQPQLTIDGFDSALDELDGDGHGPALKLVERTALNPGVGPGHEPLQGQAGHRSAVVTDTSLVSPTPSTSTRDGASLVGEPRAVPQEGA